MELAVLYIMQFGPRELIYRHRIYDEIIERIKTFNPKVTEKECKRIRKSLWLIFDGINSHNGELSENEFRPNTKKTKKDFEEEIIRCHTEEGFDRSIMPATIEGCLMRMCDKIAYIPFDMLDDLNEGIMEKIDGEHRRILMKLGISADEIDISNSKKSYEGIARKLQVIFLKSVIENSSKSVIRMDEVTSRLMHELRNANNREIINLEVLQEDQDIYPTVARVLVSELSYIIEEGIGLDELRRIAYGDNPSLQDVEAIMSRYRGTPDEKFVSYMMGTTKEIYEFNEEVVRRAEKTSYVARGQEISFNMKMRAKFATEYLSTLNDFEFLSLIEQKGYLREEQIKSLHRKYREIGREGLIKESYMQEKWKKITEAQEASIADERRRK